MPRQGVGSFRVELRACDIAARNDRGDRSGVVRFRHHIRIIRWQQVIAMQE